MPCEWILKKEEFENMDLLEKQLIKYNELKTEFLRVVKKIDSCELKEQPLYQRVALEYADYLKKFKSLLKQKYGIYNE